LKSTFALTKGRLAYMSPYFGDLDSLETEAVYLEGLERMQTLFRVQPRLVVCDLHPLYASTRIAEARAAGRGGALSGGTGLLRVQHHHAHIASVMAEHGLDGPVIGVGFDGTGYGSDGRIWGGEFLLCEGGGFRRMAHLAYVRLIGGDASMKEAWKTALCYAYAFGNFSDCAGGPAASAGGAGAVESEDGSRVLSVDLSDIMAYSNMTEAHPRARDVAAALRAGVNTVECSSAGRLFDAVASLLGICHVSRYEGECAIMLENAAAAAMARPGESRAGDLALAFHMDLAGTIHSACRRIREETGVSAAALSGGVFQNKILMGECLRRLRGDGFSVYRNAAVPPNDGGIALGQAFIGMCALRG
jgi:hydrogenase maturation protein HypF